MSSPQFFNPRFSGLQSIKYAPRRAKAIRLTYGTGTRSMSYIRFMSTIKIRDISDGQIGEIAKKVDRERLWRDLHYTCQWGRGEKWGVYVMFLFLFLFLFLVVLCFVLTVWLFGLGLKTRERMM